MANESLFNAVSFEASGFAHIDSLIDAGCCDALTAVFDAPQGAGTRHLIDHPAVHSLIGRSTVARVVRKIMGDKAFAYKATLFDKNSQANWLVAWHQDLSIPVRQRIDVDGWTGWSQKEHVSYVQPPIEVLSRLVALRIHLDDCDQNNGPLRLLRGSHRVGRLTQGKLATYVSNDREETVTGMRGGGLLMRPLLIHASSKAMGNSRRRVLHLEFADFELPAGLEWHRRVLVAA